MEDNLEIITIECPRCGCDKSFRKFYRDYSEFGECVSCGEMTYRKVFKNPTMEEFLGTTSPKSSSRIRVACPYCNSTNTKKISSFSKAAGIATFGVFALGRATKQWHCNNCKSDF